VIVYHGLKLEGKMNEIFAKMEDKTIVYSAAYEMENLIVLDESHDDPHTWFDVNLHMIGMEYVAAKLMKIDTANGDYYKTNAKEYATELMELDAYVSTQIETIPSQKRVLVSTHDAFEYFGKRYGVETHGIQGISTATEAGIKDITTTVDLVVENEIPIIFSEHSASSNTVEAVMEGAKEKGWEVSLAPSLYTDALGNEADGADTYIGMMKANVDNLVQSLTK
ncbi:MAG: metal ABC transporter solute-binding protein, Zn/Mn family, partial [Chitinophagales bacterium]